MPLAKGRSRKAIGRNIGRLKKEGKSGRQAVAIALKTAGLTKSGKRRKSRD